MWHVTAGKTITFEHTHENIQTFRQFFCKIQYTFHKVWTKSSFPIWIHSTYQGQIMNIMNETLGTYFSLLNGLLWARIKISRARVLNFGSSLGEPKILTGQLCYNIQNLKWATCNVSIFSIFTVKFALNSKFEIPKKDVWMSDKSWEPGMFECYWKLENDP